MCLGEDISYMPTLRTNANPFTGILASARVVSNTYGKFGIKSNERLENMKIVENFFAWITLQATFLSRTGMKLGENMFVYNNAGAPSIITTKNFVCDIDHFLLREKLSPLSHQSNCMHYPCVQT